MFGFSGVEYRSTTVYIGATGGDCVSKLLLLVFFRVLRWGAAVLQGAF